MTLSSKEYFALATSEDLVRELEGKRHTRNEYLESTGIKDRWIRSYNLYFGRHFKDQGSAHSSSIQRGGKEGELCLLPINHYRNLIKHILVMTTNQKPSFEVRAINSDLKSMSQARLGNNILDAYLKEKRLARHLRKAAEYALVFGKGFVRTVWEPSLGRPHSVEEIPGDEEGTTKQRLVYEGDIDVKSLSPFDVGTDLSLEDFDQAEWVELQSFRNKYNLAVRYHALRDEIEALPSRNELSGGQALTLQTLDDTSDVAVYEFYHKRTDALPNGRYVLFCDSKTVLYDGPMPYKKLPVYRITPGDIFGSTEGYSDAFDLMGIQEAIDTLYSTAFSNQNAFGVQNILMPKGAQITREQLGESLAIINYDPNSGKPEPLQLTATPKEVFDFMAILEKTAETLSGVNSVARGNPENSLKSGVALGLIQSMAVQYASGFQQSWAELLEDTGTFILDLLKTFANTERMVAMAGKHNRGQMANFTKDDLQDVDRVIVELGNPMARTTAGRVQIADNLLEKGLVKTPQEYLSVMNTGNLDPLTEGAEAELSLIKKENEELMDGRPVQALMFDSHLLHMQEHKALLANPTVRSQSPITQMVLQHIMEHMNLYKTQDPMISMVSGEPPAPQPPMGPPPGGPPPGPGGPPPGPPNGPPMGPPHGPPQGAPPMMPPDATAPPNLPLPKSAQVPPNGAPFAQ